ncbi:14642_t:CDS:2, partial [Gigaspora margarita]
PPEPRKHFLRLSQFWKHGYGEESAIEGLKAKDITQWEDTYYKARENVEKSAIRELFQILDFTGIDDIRTLSGNIILEAFTQSSIKTINAIASNWYGYTVKSNRKKIEPKEKQ